MKKILILDVDGTLTDGKINVSKDGEMFKSFHVKDGFAIKHLLPKYNITPIIITGRESKITEVRGKELDITHIYQGISDKTVLLKDFCQKHEIPLSEVAYIGDDVNDLNAMQIVGTVGCPSDAVQSVKEIADYVCVNKGGEGAVREFIEWLVK